MRCPSCGTENAPASRFCQACGTALAAQDGPSPPDGSGETQIWPAETGGLHVPAEATGQGRRACIDKLGARIDGWAEMIDGAGQQADALAQFVVQRLAERGMPQVAHYDQMLTTGGLMGERRRYHLVSHRVGAIVALLIAPFGDDLYVAWDMFVKQVWRWVTLAIIGGASVVLSLLFQLGDFDFWGWLIGTISLVISIAFFVGVAGWVLKRSFWAFFRHEYSLFRADDVTAMVFATHHSVLEGLDHIGIDQAMIRPKEEFRAGQRERII